MYRCTGLLQRDLVYNLQLCQQACKHTVATVATSKLTSTRTEQPNQDLPPDQLEQQ